MEGAESCKKCFIDFFGGLLIVDLIAEGFMEVSDGKGYFVRRRGKPLPEKGREDIDWEASYFLNALCNQMEYSLVVTSRKEHEASHELLEKVQAKVFASPHYVPAHGKIEQRAVYPQLCFQVHDYWNVGSVKVEQNASQLLGVELLCRGTLLGTECKTRIFSGALSTESIEKGHYKNQGWFQSWTKEQKEIHVALRGPKGKGEASMVVTGTEQEETKASGMLAWLKPARHISFQCMVSHVSLEWEEIVKMLLFQ